MKVLVLGVTGMLGSTVYKYLVESPRLDVFGTARSSLYKDYFSTQLIERVIPEINVLDQKQLVSVVNEVKPDVIINCVGLVKQLPGSNSLLECIPLNSLLPHRLMLLASKVNARLIHISTDCVFSGKRGHYLETDTPDAEDLYGISKSIGELNDVKNTITLRTSLIGHELNSNRSLIDWFLSQDVKIKGYRKMIFSGLSTIEMARVIRDFVLPNPHLEGLYHVSSEPIGKYELLKLVAKIYRKEIEIIPDDEIQIDRSLVSDKFFQATGYRAPSWPDLVEAMYQARVFKK